MNLKKMYIYIIIVILIFNVLLYISPTKNLIFKFFQEINTNIQNVQQSVIDFEKNFENIKKVQQENASLKDEVNLLKKSNDELTKANEEITTRYNSANEQLNISKTKDIKTLVAEVMYRNINSWEEQLKINKGTSGGVALGNPVLFNNTLVGKITEVGKDSSTVTLLTNPGIDFNIPVNFIHNGKEVDGLINSYNKNKDLLTVSTMYDSSEIAVGDKIYTNGYDENIPKGIYVGKVEAIDKSNEVDKKYYVKVPKQTMNYVEVRNNES